MTEDSVSPNPDGKIGSSNKKDGDESHSIELESQDQSEIDLSSSANHAFNDVNTKSKALGSNVEQEVEREDADVNEMNPELRNSLTVTDVFGSYRMESDRWEEEEEDGNNSASKRNPKSFSSFCQRSFSASQNFMKGLRGSIFNAFSRSDLNDSIGNELTADSTFQEAI